ncbi:MAG: histidine phosphatase family protein [Chloroflexota bacterium]
MSRTIYIITHPNVVIDPNVPITQWPLSETGRARMECMLQQPWVGGITAVYASTEQKAIDGAVILADHLKLPYETMEALGEIDRSSTGYLPREEHDETAVLCFTNPHKSIRGWEPANSAQQRMVKAVNAIIAKDKTKTNGAIGIVTHGAVATFLLCHLQNIPIAAEHDQPPTSGGNYFCFDAATKHVEHGWKQIDDISR